VRRLNLTLGDRLLDYETDAPAVRRVLIRRAVARGASPKITLPPEHLEWVRALSRQALDALRERGYVPHDYAAQPMPQFSEAEMADAAISTLATFAVELFRDAQNAVARRAERGKPNFAAD